MTAQKIAKLDDQISVAPQLIEMDFDELPELGFKSVINCRPDGEGDRPYISAAAAAEAAEDNDLQYVHIPVPMGGFTADQVEAFAKAVADLPKPILAHCGSGKRASVLWALSNPSDLDVNGLINCCAKAGHDISPLAPQLMARAK